MRHFEPQIIPQIATDLQFNEPFSFSFWIQVNAGIEKKNIMQVTMPDDSKIQCQF